MPQRHINLKCFSYILLNKIVLNIIIDNLMISIDHNYKDNVGPNLYIGVHKNRIWSKLYRWISDRNQNSKLI